MVDYETLSPAEQETEIRRAYADAQRTINALIPRLQVKEKEKILKPL